MAKGPSCSQTPYLVALDKGVSFTSILTTGDIAGIKMLPASEAGEPWRMVGTPDGLGAYDNGNGTITVLMNHELSADQGTVRAHDSTGAFVSRLIVDKGSLDVLGAEDLIRTVYTWDPEDKAYEAGTTAFDRLCSADLAEPTAFFNPATNKGYAEGRIYTNGEEAGLDGRAFAHFATGPEAGSSYELPHLGKFSHENQVPNPHPMDQTIVIGLDDSSPGQVYVYMGEKEAEGTPLEKAGLVGGHLYGIAIEDHPDEDREAAFGDDEVPFRLADLGHVSGMTGEELQALSEAQGVTEFLRPEDGAWDPVLPTRFYFVTTDRFDETKPDAAAAPSEEPHTPSSGVPQEPEEPQIGRSRLWQLDFEDLSDPSKGGTLTMLLNGTEAHQMLDNITVSDDGTIVMQEDPGDNSYLAKIWQYNPDTDKLALLAQHDPTRFGSGSEALTMNEESSGIIDVTGLLGEPGKNVYLLDVQAHYDRERELDEGGQLLTMTVDDMAEDGTMAGASSLDPWI